MQYYDKNGEPIDLFQWANLLNNFEYKVIKQENLPNGFRVSTVWLGLDHNFITNGQPLIFETMVFDSNHPQEIKFDKLKRSFDPDVDMERYSTLKQAIEGHQLMIIKWKDKSSNDPLI